MDGAGVAKFLPLHAALAEVLLQLLSAELVVDETAKRDGVTESLERRDGVLEKEHGRKDEEDVLEYTGEGKDERGGLATQENDGDVEQESDGCVGQQSGQTNTVDVSHRHLGELSEHENDTPM